MTEEATDILIDPCPRCGSRHRYSLRVLRSLVSHYMPDMAAAVGKPVDKSFTRLFVCPAGNEVFQATISLPAESGTRINTVEVGGIRE